MFMEVTAVAELAGVHAFEKSVIFCSLCFIPLKTIQLPQTD